MQAPIETRAFRPADYDAVLRLWRASPGVEIAEGDDRATVTRYLRRNPGLSRVAERDGRIVGAMLCGHDGRRGLIYHLAVAQKFHGQGLGRRLVGEGLAGLRAAGILRALLLVDPGNRPGRAFWRSLGFEVVEAVILGIDV